MTSSSAAIAPPTTVSAPRRSICEEYPQPLRDGFGAPTVSGIPRYSWAGEGPGSYDGNDHQSTWYPVTAAGKLSNTFVTPTP